MYKKESFVYVRFGNPPRTLLARTKLFGLPPYTKCIIKTPRGTEFAETLPTHRKLEKQEVTNIKILRRANQVDINYFNAIKRELEPKEAEFFEKKIQELKLNMELLLVEHLFGNERIIFSFYSKEKIDFRELLKILAKEFKTHIELRQLNKMERLCVLSEVGPCGRPLCCKTMTPDYCSVYKRITALELSKFTSINEQSQSLNKRVCCLIHGCYMELRENLCETANTIKGT